MRLAEDKRGTEITFNAIIIAILVMIVLVVIVLILTGAFGVNIVPGLNLFMTCEGRDGNCAPTCEPGEYKIYKYAECGKDDKEEYCCFPKG